MLKFVNDMISQFVNQHVEQLMILSMSVANRK